MGRPLLARTRRRSESTASSRRELSPILGVGVGEASGDEAPLRDRLYAASAALNVYSLSRLRRVKPSAEKSTSFCSMLLRIKSKLRPHADAVVAAGSQPVPMRNLRSAFWMVVRNIFSALGESRPV